MKRKELITDKLNVTLPVHPALQSNVVQRLTHLCNGPAPIDAGQVRPRNGYNSYRHSFWIRLGGRARCLLQAGPIRSSDDANFLRLEWNPSKSRNSLDVIVQALREVMPDFTLEEFFRSASITRIDLAFDLLRIPIETLGVFAMLRRPHSSTYQTHTIFEPLGRINCLEIGQRRGRVFLCVYDKLLEQKNRQIDGFADLHWSPSVPLAFAPSQQVPITARNGALSDSEQQRVGAQACLAPNPQRQPARRLILASRTRVELRLREVGSFNQFDTMPNPFARYTFVRYQAVQSARAGQEWPRFLDLCRCRGAQSALSLIEDNRARHRFRDSIRSSNAPGWWSPEVIWGERHSAIRAMFN